MRVIVVDDEPLARRGLRQMLRRESDVEIVGECSSAADAVKLIDEIRPDLVFLDIRMPGADGLSVARQRMSNRTPLYVFVTAYSAHAVEAFDVRAIDYILKPVEQSRIAEACQRAREYLQRHGGKRQLADNIEVVEQTGLGVVTTPIAGRIVIHSADRAIILKPSEIDWFEAAGNYVKIHTSKTAYVVRETLNKLEVVLQGEPFARIHRSTLINLDSVKELQPWVSGEMLVLMKDGTKLKLSRTYRRVLETRLRFLA